MFLFSSFSHQTNHKETKNIRTKRKQKNFRLLHRRLRRRRRSPGDYWLEEGGAKLHAITANCSNRGSF